MLSLAAHRTQPLKKTREGGSLYSKLPVKKTHGFFLRVPFAVIFSFAYLSRSLEKKRAYKRKDNNSFPFEACVPSSCWPPVVSYAFSLRLYPLKKNEHTKEKITTVFPSKPSLYPFTSFLRLVKIFLVLLRDTKRREKSCYLFFCMLVFFQGIQAALTGKIEDKGHKKHRKGHHNP